MMSSSENYDQDFPLLRNYDTTDEKGVSSHQPKILNPLNKDAEAAGDEKSDIDDK